jgi:hypothetical protein
MAQTTNVGFSINPYIYGANADATNVATLYAPAELGAQFYNSGNKYQRVQVDSGATSATPTGAVLATQLAYWLDKSKKIVTNDSRFALAGSPNVAGSTGVAQRNAVAGIFRVAATAGYYVDVLQKGNGVLVNSDNSGTVGQIAIPASSTTVPSVTASAIGTAPPYPPVGIIRAVPTGSSPYTVTVDVDIASVD